MVLSRSHNNSLTPSFFSNLGVTSSNFSKFLSALKIAMYLFYHDIIYICTINLEIFWMAKRESV